MAESVPEKKNSGTGKIVAIILASCVGVAIIILAILLIPGMIAKTSYDKAIDESNKRYEKAKNEANERYEEARKKVEDDTAKAQEETERKLKEAQEEIQRKIEESQKELGQ